MVSQFLKFKQLARCIPTSLLALAFCTGDIALGAEQHKKEISLIVPFGRNGDTDIVARNFAPLLSKHLSDTNIHVVNHPGVDGNVGINELKKSPPDGSVLLLGGPNSLVAPYSAQENITPEWDNLKFISVILTQPLVCVTGAQSSIKNHRDFFEKIRTQPSEIRHVTTGNYGILFPTYFLRLIGLRYDKLKSIKAATAPNAVQMLIDGKADFMCASLPHLIPLIAQGKLRAIFSNATRPIKEYPDIPIARNLGIRELDRYVIWTVLIAPKSTPENALVKIKNALKNLANDPEWKNSELLKYGTNGLIHIKDSEEFIREEAAFYENLVILSRLVK